MKIITILFTLLLAGNSYAINDLSDVQFYTEELYPYNFTKDGEYDGFSYELIKNALAASHKDLDFDEQLEFVPWSRAYNIALKEKNIAIFSTARTDAREKYFNWVGPIAHAQRIVITKKKDKINIESSDDLKKYSITVIQEDISDHLTKLLGLEENVTKTYDLDGSIKNLTSGASDILIYNPEATISKMKELGLNIYDYKFGQPLSSGNFYIALSKATPNYVVKQLQLSIDNYKKTEEYEQLRVKYNFHLFDTDEFID